MPKQITMEFAGSIISNYRSLYKEKMGISFIGTDKDILNITNSDNVASTGEEQDQWTIESMQEIQDEILLNSGE